VKKKIRLDDDMKYRHGQENLRIPIPEKEVNEMFAIVNRVLGGSRMNVQSEDGKTRMARIPGRMRRRIGRIKIGDLIIITPWDIQDEKADILYRYRRNQIRFLNRRDMLPTEICLLL
jgi:translation initiation factor 1A